MMVMTPSQRRRRRRDDAIAEGRRRGLSLRALAAIHSLSASRVAELLEDLGVQKPPENSEREKISPSLRADRN